MTDPLVHPPVHVVRAAVALALAEDLTPLGDLSAALLPAHAVARATFVSRQRGVLAGTRCAAEAFRQLDESLVVVWQVDDGDALKPKRLSRMHRTERSIREHAETAAKVFLRVMARWPHERVGRIKLAADDLLDRDQRATDSQQGDLKTTTGEWRDLAGVTTTGVTQLLHTSDVFLGVVALDLFDRCHARLDGDKVISHAADVDQVLKAALGRGVLGVLTRLEPTAGRHEGGTRTGVPPHITLVPNKSGLHSISLPSLHSPVL